MSNFTIPQESIAGAPTIDFRFDGSLATAELAGATLTADASVGDGDRANLSIVDEQGEVIADIMVRKVETDSTITETVCRIGSALLWSHARWREAQAKQPAPSPTLGIYRYVEDFGRMGHLSGVFIAEHADVEAAMGKTAYLGEVLGKHSDVHAEISADTVKLVTADPVIMEMFASLGLRTGVNPIAALEDE